MTYKSYWQSAILTKLDEYHRSERDATISQLRFAKLLFNNSNNKSFFCSIDTGICIEDIIQTLIDLQIAYTSMSTIDTTYKKQEVRDQRQRRRQKSNSDCDQYDDNNNALNSTSVLSINEDVLHTALTRLSNENRSSKSDQHVFDPNYLRLTSRR